jgi:hypothetical protein
MTIVIATLLALYAANRLWRNETSKVATKSAWPVLPYRVERSGARMAGEAAWRESSRAPKFGQGGLL